MKPLALLSAFCFLLSAAYGQAVRYARPSMTPSQVAKVPATYVDRTVTVRGYPTLPAKPEAGTGIWKGTSDGVKIEMTAEAKAFYDKAKPTGITPNFHATLRRRGGEYVLVYEKGLPLKRPGASR